MNVMVTVGLCVKNSEKTIQESINSIINQEYPSELVQVIVVDGCSSDKTLSIAARATATTEMKIETYSDNRKGLGFARQIVVANSVGKYIIFVDSDARLFNDYVKEQVRFVEENPKVGVGFAKSMFQKGPLVSEILGLFNYAVEFSRGTTATIFRTEAVRQAGGFDSNIEGAAEDVDLIARIQANGWSVSVNREAKFFHKYRESLKEFWVEQTWFGYGSHFLNHKNKNLNPAWRNLPIGYFFFLVRTAAKAYKMTLRKTSFLIPFQMLLGNIFWWFGFVKAHINGYGHKIVPHKIELLH